MLYYIIFVAAVVLVFYIFDVVVANHLLSIIYFNFQHTLECSLEYSLILLRQSFVRCPLSISLLLMERPVRSLVQSQNAN